MLQEREVLSMGFTKGMGPCGGCINFVFLEIYRYIHTYESLLVKEISKTTLSIENVSCHVSLSHYVSIYLSIYFDRLK